MLSGKTIVVGVTGGIAAYKALDVVSRLRKLGAEIHVIMTRNATKLVAPITFRTLSNNPVIVEMFEEPKQWNVEHVALAEAADLLLICPATANVIGKIASGIADDFLTTTVMACPAPKVICPAMNYNMYANPIVQGNISKLRDLGYIFIEPEYGRLASGAVGRGRLPEPEKIVAFVENLMTSKQDLKGLSIMVTAGPTREWLDPVRFISNPSSGKMGYAIAEAALDRGASVYLVSGPVTLPHPKGVTLKMVDTTEDMLRACLEAWDSCQVAIGAAAPCDFRPINQSPFKMKKTGENETIVFEPTPDIMKTLGQNKGDRILVGFAAETDNVIEYAKEKILKKNLDFVCANKVGKDQGFGSDQNSVTMIYPDGRTLETGVASKSEIAHAILDRIKELAQARGFLPK